MAKKKATGETIEVSSEILMQLDDLLVMWDANSYEEVIQILLEHVDSMAVMDKRAAE